MVHAAIVEIINRNDSPWFEYQSSSVSLAIQYSKLVSDRRNMLDVLQSCSIHCAFDGVDSLDKKS